MMNTQSALVYFDGACPLCSAEISNIKNKLCDVKPNTDAAINFVDIHSADELPKPKSQLLKDLHLYTPNGKLHVGLDANIEMWRLGGSRILVWFSSSALVYPVAKLIYRLWADRRFRNKYQAHMP